MAKNEKTILDTSFQIEKLKHDSKFEKGHLSPGSKPATLFFVLYEFKSGFLRCAIDYYALTKTMGSAADAQAKWSNKFQPRKLKNVHILESIIKRISEKLSASSQVDSLRMIESAIQLCLNRFDLDIELIGSFAADPIVKFELFGGDSYTDFINLHNARETIPLSSFWNKHNEELLALTNDESLYPKKYNYVYKQLNKVKSNLNNADRVEVNKAIGDPVIASDAPHTYTILSTDKIYKILCPAIKKPDPKIIPVS